MILIIDYISKIVASKKIKIVFHEKKVEVRIFVISYYFPRDYKEALLNTLFVGKKL